MFFERIFIMKQFYKIGEISKLYQIGTDSLRYYEELGILTPVRGENNYRMYGLNDLWRLNVIRDLRRLDFPMEKIQEYMKNRTIESTRKLFEEELHIIEQQIHLLNNLKANVSDRLATLNQALEQPLGEVIVKHFEKRNCHQIFQTYHTDEEMDMLIKQLLNIDNNNLYIIGNNRIGSFLPLDHAIQEDYSTYKGVFIIDQNGTSSLKEGTYLSICYRGDSHQHAIYFPKLLEFATAHNFQLEGNLLELLWVDIHQESDYSQHITELQIRCK